MVVVIVCGSDGSGGGVAGGIVSSGGESVLHRLCQWVLKQSEQGSIRAVPVGVMYEP